MFSLTPDITLIGPAVYVKSLKTLSISDMHLGYEEILHKQGVLTPKFQLADARAFLTHAFAELEVEQIIVNGDLKHTFGGIQESEWSEILRFVEFCMERVKRIIVVTGNHDLILDPILRKKGMATEKWHEEGGMLFAHGDELIETTAQTVVLGHDHPAIIISDGIRREKYKCHLVVPGKRTVIVQPSFHTITLGTDVLSHPMSTPFIHDSDSREWRILVVEGYEVMDFGRLGELI